jgi:hypothetical protein
MVICYFFPKIKKWIYGVMLALFFAKNGHFEIVYGNGAKSFFLKTW